MNYNYLLEAATGAMKNSYSPYSHFAVGAALLTESGTIYTGCNIENAAYPLCCCAERTAFFKALSEGEKRFTAIAVVGSGDKACYPCGSCRQVMAEFCSPDFIIATTDGETTLSELLPKSFGKSSLSDCIPEEA